MKVGADQFLLKPKFRQNHLPVPRTKLRAVSLLKPLSHSPSTLPRGSPILSCLSVYSPFFPRAHLELIFLGGPCCLHCPPLSPNSLSAVFSSITLGSEGMCYTPQSSPDSIPLLHQETVGQGLFWSIAVSQGPGPALSTQQGSTKCQKMDEEGTQPPSWGR